jgi:hypothetical protein
MKSLLMQTLPNSGSTWFATLLAQHIPGCRYYDKEFFNPVCNLKHEMVLRRNFGCELVECYRNNALPGDEHIDDDIKRTWGNEDYTFTKECNSAFKLPAFARHFNCFVFLRSAAYSFPPDRVRVWSFYEHAWFALREAGHELIGVRLHERAYEAHGILRRVILADAAQLGIPVIHYEELFLDPAAIMDRLRSVAPVQDTFLEAVMATRRKPARVAA